MAFFKFRKGGDEHPTPPPVAESVEVMRKRAKHRLIGAAVLVLVGVVGFPLLFDNQPRPILVDIPIEIPDKAKAKPLPPVAPIAPAAPVVVPPPVQSTPASTPEIAPVPEPKLAPEHKPEPEPKKAPAPEPVQPKAQAHEKPAAESTARFVVQVGAFADVAKAREARMKVERAGMKTYTQVLQNKDGKRIRVRVGPFESKAAAEKAAEKIKKLGLTAGIFEL